MKAILTSATKTRITLQMAGHKKIYWDLHDDFNPNLSEQSLSNLLVRSAFGAAMRRGEDLEVEVPVDARLARNLQRFSSVWSQYRPTLFKRASRVIAPSYIHGKPNEENSFVAAFSGGYDSSYMIAAYSSPEPPYPKVSSAIMIDGFGYDLQNKTSFSEALRLGRDFVKGLNVDLLHVESNWPKVVLYYPVMHSLGISAVLGLKSNSASGAYIGLDFAAPEEFRLGPWGNMAGTNRLFSSSDFEIFPVGDEKKRLDKIRYLRDLKLDSHIVVCNAPNRTSLNCGRCEKCLRTQLGYRAIGIDVKEGQFAKPLTKIGAAGITITKQTQFIFYTAMAESWANKQDPYLAIVKYLLATSKVK